MAAVEKSKSFSIPICVLEKCDEDGSLPLSISADKKSVRAVMCASSSLSSLSSLNPAQRQA